MQANAYAFAGIRWTDLSWTWANIYGSYIGVIIDWLFSKIAEQLWFGDYNDLNV